MTSRSSLRMLYSMRGMNALADFFFVVGVGVACAGSAGSAVATDESDGENEFCEPEAEEFADEYEVEEANDVAELWHASSSLVQSSSSDSAMGGRVGSDSGVRGRPLRLLRLLPLFLAVGDGDDACAECNDEVVSLVLFVVPQRNLVRLRCFMAAPTCWSSGFVSS